MPKLEAETGMRVNTVILDCEGCWVDLVSTYRDKFRSSVDKIILGIMILLIFTNANEFKTS